MSEPDKHPSSTDRPAMPSGRQPAYGRIVRPEYGALSSDFPASYNPYVYGEPDRSADASASVDGPNGGVAPQAGTPGRNMQASGADASTRPGGSGRSDQSRLFHGINLDDPSQNPLYGRWDAYAIVAFIFSLSSIPLLPAIMGGVAMWRTRTFRMKGFGLALTAVILNLLVTVMDVWMMANGLSMADLMQWAQGQSAGGGTQGSGMLST